MKAYNVTHSTEKDLKGAFNIVYIWSFLHDSVIILSKLIFHTLYLILKSIIPKLMIIYVEIK